MPYVSVSIFRGLCLFPSKHHVLASVAWLKVWRKAYFVTQAVYVTWEYSWKRVNVYVELWVEMFQHCFKDLETVIYWLFFVKLTKCYEVKLDKISNNTNDEGWYFVKIIWILQLRNLKTFKWLKNFQFYAIYSISFISNPSILYLHSNTFLLYLFYSIHLF